MNLSKSYTRNTFVEVDRYSLQNNKSHQPKPHSRRDPFEGDPFKIQSLNFRYADKPGYPVSNRGKGSASADKSPIKGLYFNHDHTIPKCNKENLSPRHSREFKQQQQQQQHRQQFVPVRKSSSIRSIAVTSKTFRIEKGVSRTSSISQQLHNDSQSQFSLLNSRRSLTKLNAQSSSTSQQQVSQGSELSVLSRGSSTVNRDLCTKKSKPCICIPTMSSNSYAVGHTKVTARSKTVPSVFSTTSTTSTQKRFFRSRSNISDPMTDIDVNHSGSCHVTIKINGVPKNRVHIAKNRNNVEINLVKPKKLNKKPPKSPLMPKPVSPHAIKPSRSYIIHKSEASTTTDLRKSNRRGTSHTAMKESSTLSMVPHKEEKSTAQESTMTSLFDTAHSSEQTFGMFSNDRPFGNCNNDRPTVLYSNDRPRTVSRTSIPNKISGNHAAMLEKILSNNPIILQPKGRIIFTRAQTGLGQRSSSVAVQAGN